MRLILGVHIENNGGRVVVGVGDYNKTLTVYFW